MSSKVMGWTRQSTGKAVCQPLAVQPQGGLVSPCLALGDGEEEGGTAACRGCRLWPAPLYHTGLLSEAGGGQSSLTADMAVPGRETNARQQWRMPLPQCRPRRAAEGAHRTPYMCTRRDSQSMCCWCLLLSKPGSTCSLGDDTCRSFNLYNVPFQVSQLRTGKGTPPPVCSGHMGVLGWKQGNLGGNQVRKRITKDAPGKMSFWRGVGEAEWVSVALTPESSLASLCFTRVCGLWCGWGYQYHWPTVRYWEVWDVLFSIYPHEK